MARRVIKHALNCSPGTRCGWEVDVLPAPSRAQAPTAPWGGSSPFGPDPQLIAGGWFCWGRRTIKTTPWGMQPLSGKGLANPPHLGRGHYFGWALTCCSSPLCFACSGKNGCLEDSFMALIDLSIIYPTGAC